MYHCRYKIVVFSLSILTSNDTEIRITCFYVFFPFVNIFANDMIKTPTVFVSPSLKNLKIRNDLTKTSKIGPFMESLSADFFQFSVKIIKSFVLSS